MPYAEARKLVEPSGRLHRLPRSQDHAAARHAARLHRRHPRAQGLAGRQRLRRQHDGHAPGDALVTSAASATSSITSKAPEKRLTYPWHKGLKVEEIVAYYDEAEFKDWTHAETGAPVLKAQHPEFEMWNQGIHARSGVACADCHMPYKREGAHQDQRPSRAQPAAEHQPRLPDLPQVARGGAEGARRDDPGPHLRAAQPRDGRADGPDRRHQGGQGSRRNRRANSPPRATSSARRSSTWTSSRPRTRWASTRRRRPRGFSASPLIFARGKGDSRVERPNDDRFWALARHINHEIVIPRWRLRLFSDRLPLDAKFRQFRLLGFVRRRTG